jgi:isopentenyl-diphosphate delta-isomerase type 1
MLNGQHQAGYIAAESETLVLVDETDLPVGYLSKALCHRGIGVLHRAFSLFIFNHRGELLLQQRAPSKPLWPLFWSNSCCSHPRRAETMEAAIHRRLIEELGVRCPMQFLFKFQYLAQFDATHAEHEMCSVYPNHVAEFLDEAMALGIEGIMVSPGYSYERAPRQDVFLERSASKQLFREIFKRGRRGRARSRWPSITRGFSWIFSPATRATNARLGVHPPTIFSAGNGPAICCPVKDMRRLPIRSWPTPNGRTAASVAIRPATTAWHTVGLRAPRWMTRSLTLSKRSEPRCGAHGSRGRWPQIYPFSMGSVPGRS